VELSVSMNDPDADMMFASISKMRMPVIRTSSLDALLFFTFHRFLHIQAPVCGQLGSSFQNIGSVKSPPIQIRPTDPLRTSMG